MIHINDEFLPIFAKFFNRSTILEFLYKKKPHYIIDSLCSANIDVRAFSSKKYKDLFDIVYEYISDKYACEYVYKNEALMFEIISGRHNDDAKLLSEVAVGKSKADIVVINGTTTVYEIKTELDNVMRLESQLDDYLMVFDRVNILTCQNKLSSIEKILESKTQYSVVGICTMEMHNQVPMIKSYRESQTNLCNTHPRSIFNVINYSEFKKFFPDMDISSVTSVDINKVQSMFMQVLKERAKNQIFIDAMPRSLKMIGSSLQKLSKKDREKLIFKLDNSIVIS
jgi:hypothetical protein